MRFFSDLHGYFFTTESPSITQTVMPQLKEAIKKYNFEVLEDESLSFQLITGKGSAINLVEIESQENGEYMVRVNNRSVISDVPLGLINDLIITEIEFN